VGSKTLIHGDAGNKVRRLLDGVDGCCSHN